MEERLVWWNGDFVKESEAKISIYDSALKNSSNSENI